MNRLQLYRLLRKNTQKSYRRSPAFEQSMVGKVLLVLGSALFVFYLIGIGAIFGMAVNENGVGVIMPFMPFILILDFFLRFSIQQTPDMLAKPYILLPMSKYAVIENFLLSSLLSIYNFLWLAMFLTYSVLALVSGCSWGEVLLILVTCQLLMILNSQFYLAIRTLVNRSLLWWFPALAVLALPFVPCLFLEFDSVFDFYSEHATHPIVFLCVVALSILFFFLNRKMQFTYVYEEISKAEKTTLKNVSSFSFLDRFGETGEYLKLEIKSIMRNKVMRSRCFASLALISVFSGLCAYTPIYDGITSSNFLCFYCFALYGVTSLTKVMGPEGNYIDLLMTHRENIFSLLLAKYYFHLAVLVVPFAIMIPAVCTGKFTWLQLLGYMCMSGGLLYFIMFQLAVYNKQTLLLEQKLTGKGNFENGMQLIVITVAFLLPFTLVSILIALFDELVANLSMCIIGILFIATHHFWLHNIYNRMMKRRYANLEGFHSTR